MQHTLLQSLTYKKAASNPTGLEVLWVKETVVDASIWREDFALGVSAGPSTSITRTELLPLGSKRCS